MCQICAITEDLVNSFLSFLQMLWFFCRISEGDGRSDGNLLSDKMRASVIYRMGQKRLVRGFLQEAEMALEVCLDHVSSD